ncbi:portal protein, partial [Bacteroides mediterraneensis]|uniref:portal protein n=1 Tax=Bacteroides mediterraneensis TaxID=1841856 RepID=UPI001959320F
YVFFKQNNGFLISYTAITDALQLKNCAIMWRWKETEKTDTTKYKGLTDEALTLLVQQLADGQPEIVEASTELVVDQMSGMPVNVHDVKIKTTRKTGKVHIEAFPPEELLVARNWNSPILEDCPYVCRMMRVTLSELREMGFDVEVDDLTDADRIEVSADRT